MDKKKVFVFLVLALCIVPQFVLADAEGQEEVEKWVTHIITLGQWFAGIFGGLLLVFVGFQFMMAKGPEDKDRAMSRIKYILVGIIIAELALTIVKLIKPA